MAWMVVVSSLVQVRTVSIVMIVPRPILVCVLVKHVVVCRFGRLQRQTIGDNVVITVIALSAFRAVRPP